MSAPLSVILCALAGLLISLPLSRKTSVICALAGSLAGYRVWVLGWQPDPELPTMWISSAAACALVSGLVYRLMLGYTARNKRHLLNRMWGLGLVFNLSLAAFGAAFLLNLYRTARTGQELFTWVAASTGLVAAAAVAALPLVQKAAHAAFEKYMDLDIVMGISTAVPAAAAMFLSPAPLSPLVLALCGTVGCHLASGWSTERLEAAPSLICSLLIAPGVAFAMQYMIMLYSRHGADSQTVLATVGIVAVVLVLIFGTVILRERRASKYSGRRIEEQEDELEFNRSRLGEMESRIMRMENDNLQNLLAMKRRDTVIAAEKLAEQNAFLDSIYSMVVEAENCPDEQTRSDLLHEIRTKLGLRRNQSAEQDDFYAQVEQLHRDFSARLEDKYPQLTAQERKLATLLRLEFSTKYIASLLSISPKSVEIERHRLRRKLGLVRNQNLTDFIRNI